MTLNAGQSVGAFPPVDEPLRVGAPVADAIETAQPARPHQHQQRVDDLAAAVHLQREVESGGTHAVEERGQRRGSASALRQPGKTREFDEGIDVALETRDELARPRQADQRHARRRVLALERAQRRHGAQEIAQLQGAKHGDFHFSSMKGPIASASMGEVQKHSTASRGEQTTGSLRVLNDVFTRTGTPVRRSNARTRS